MPREAPYLRVADSLRARIAAGDWSVGTRLPGRGELGQHYGVGQGVIQKAQELLIIEGLLEGRAGSGTYVRTPRRRHRLLRAQHDRPLAADPFQAEMLRLEMAGTWESRTEARVPAPQEIADRLGIEAGAQTVRTDYEHLADGKPVFLTRSWEPMALTGTTPVVLPEAGPLGGAGVVRRMHSIGVRVAYVRETPRPGRATQAEANLLGLGVGQMLTRIERVHVSDQGVAVETADITVGESRWDISYEVPVELPADPI